MDDDVVDDYNGVGVGFGAGFLHRSEKSWKTIKADFDFTSKHGFYTWFGFGGSPLHNDKMRLSITGDAGFTLAKFEDFLLGCDADFVYRFNERFGLYADVGLFLGLSSGCKLIPIKAGASFTL